MTISPLPLPSDPDKLRFLFKNDLLLFARYGLGYDLVAEAEHRDLCDFIMGPRMRMTMILCSRDTLKTTIMLSYVLWRLIARGETNLRFMLYGKTADQARGRLSGVKDKITTAPMINLLYGDLNGSRKNYVWNNDEINLASRTDFSAKEPNVFISGVDTEKTGSHLDVLICDDVVTPLNSQTAEQTAVISSRFKALSPLVSERRGGIAPEVFWVDTPFSDCDFTAELKKSFKDRMSYFERPAYLPISLDIEGIATEDEFLKKGGRLLFPNSLPFKRLKHERTLMQSQFFSQYLLNPFNSADRLLKTERIKYINTKDVPAFNLRTFVITDPAGDVTKGVAGSGNSATAIVVMSISPEGDVYLRDGEVGGFSAADTMGKIFRFCAIYNPSCVGVEKTGIGSLGSQLRVEFQKMSKWVVVEDLLPRGRSKHSRVSGLDAVIALGKFYVVNDLPCLAEFREQAESWSMSGSKSAKTDCIDAVAYINDLIATYRLPHAVDSKPKDDLSRLDLVSQGIWRGVRKEADDREALRYSPVDWIEE